MDAFVVVRCFTRWVSVGISRSYETSQPQTNQSSMNQMVGRATVNSEREEKEHPGVPLAETRKDRSQPMGVVASGVAVEAPIARYRRDLPQPAGCGAF